MKTLIAWWKRYWKQPKRECGMCRFWTGSGNNSMGECRRNPPVGNWDDETRWNSTAWNEWCGCWEKS